MSPGSQVSFCYYLSNMTQQLAYSKDRSLYDRNNGVNSVHLSTEPVLGKRAVDRILHFNQVNA